MKKIKVYAHFLHGKQKTKLKEIMPGAIETDSFLYGKVNPKIIKKYEKNGIHFEILPEEKQIQTPGIQAQKVVPLVAKKLNATKIKRKALRLSVDKNTTTYYLIQLDGPLVDKWRDSFQNLKVVFTQCIPINNYIAKLDPSQKIKIKKLSFVNKVRLYTTEDTNAAVSEMIKPKTKQKISLKYDVRLHPNAKIKPVLSWLEKNKIKILGNTKYKVRIQLLQNSRDIDKIIDLDEVFAVEEYKLPKLNNDVARSILGIDDDVGELQLVQTGKYQVVGIADTGIDSTHPDLKKQIKETIALGRPGDASDPDGHGTHVAGSIVGDGSASNGLIRGMAPKAKVVFQSILDDNGRLGGIPIDYGDLFKQAYRKGARIHNNSWGSDAESRYTAGSMEVDRFVSEHRDMLIVISAGNEGTASFQRNTPDGHIEWVSIGSPATAKNVLTVGASRSYRTEHGISEFSWNDFDDDDYPVNPIAREMVSGDPESLAAFSSRGPCEEARIKPDLVAPGTNIASAKSVDAPSDANWGPYPRNRKYVFMGGTSMASTIAAGCAVLVREYYTRTTDHTPSAALLKATLVNGTKWLSGRDASYDEKQPNYHQGHGMIYMPWTIPQDDNFVLEYKDTWKTTSKHFKSSGQRHRYIITIDEGEFLCLCLTWTDPPGNGIQNSLRMTLENLATTQSWVPNYDRPSKIHKFDRSNNVQSIKLENIPTGDYMIKIGVDNLLVPGQDYALVVTGHLTSKIRNYHGGN